MTAILAGLPGLILPYLTSGFDADKLELAHRLWLIMLPAAFMTGLSSIWSGMLNAGNRFGLAALSPIAAPIASALGLVLVPGRAVDAMAVGFVLGCLIQLLALGWELRRHGIRGLPGWHGGLPETRSLFRISLPLIGNGIVFGGLPLVDTAMAATLGDRQLAILSYGNRLILPIMGISSAALATVVFPFFSRLVAEGDWRGLQRTLTTYTRLILLASIPFTVALVLMSGSVVQALYERGEFTAADTAAVARVQAVLALMVPAYALGVLYARVLISLRKTQLMLISSVIVFVANVIGDLVLKEWIGIEGIALATVVNYGLQLAITWWICRQLLRDRLAGEGGW
jgi:putative peptidoglycan lipid II flippase